MNKNATILISEKSIQLNISGGCRNNKLFKLIESFDYNELFDYLKCNNITNKCIKFYINYIKIDTFKTTEEQLYSKNPDAEGEYKGKIIKEFLFESFTCINPQRNYYPSYVPILHISSLDYFDTEVINSKAFVLPRYIKYIDSSIWNYYVPYARKDDKTESFKDRLFRAIVQIISNSITGVYTINNAREYADLHARQAKQAYMSGVGAHTKNVSPYLFHSESEMEKWIVPSSDSMEKKLKITEYLEIYKWRMLIVDDFAEEALKTYPKGGSTLTKTKIIIDILAKRFCLTPRTQDRRISLYSEKGKEVICIDCVSNINSDAIDMLKTKTYDIILLDYLLKYKDSIQREYSYELLDSITSDEKLRLSAAPLKKYWIFHISSFRSAIQERLQEKGYNYNGEFWQIAQGACPINTPRLFEYRLYQFMERQILSLSFKFKSYNIAKRLVEETNILTLTDYFSGILKVKNTSVKEHATSEKKISTNVALQKCIYQNFRILLHMREYYQVLEKENERPGGDSPSFLISSIYNEFQDYSKPFWEHLIHLMFLISYGNAPQWYEMSEELYFIKGKMKADLVELIQDYIDSFSKTYK